MTDVLVDQLRERLGDRVRTDEETRADHRHDTWVLSDLLDFHGKPGPSPKAVLFPESTDEVAHVVRACREARVPLVPFGGGSGCCGAIRADADVLVLSTRRLRGLRDLDPVAMVATFGAGTMGIDAEEQVEKEGFTIGHWPQSVELSTVGGWVATRASGQFSTLYGSIEDVVLALEVVLPDGSILRTRRTPRSAAGPDLKQLFMGSEGLLGVVTEVTFSMRPRPESRRGIAFQFKDFPSGLEAVRQIMREGWRPPVVRLYDPPEAAYRFVDWCSPGQAFLILLHEGPFLGVTAEAEGVADLCRAAGGVEASSAAVDHWLEHRNQVPGWREFFERGIILDTIEVAATWDRIIPLYERATASLREVPGILAATAHSSHSYRSGTCIYFTFLARPEDPEEMASTYRECWRRVMDVTLSLGAGITHHHGIGRLRKGVLAKELGEAGVGLLRAIKQALDPEALLNPGALLPDADEEEG